MECLVMPPLLLLLSREAEAVSLCSENGEGVSMEWEGRFCSFLFKVEKEGQIEEGREGTKREREAREGPPDLISTLPLPTHCLFPRCR